MRNRLISTAGTSLFGNIKGEYKEYMGVAEEVHQRLQGFLNEDNIGQLSRELAKIEPSARICGAEINSIDEAVRREKVSLEHLDFLVSDTDDGKKTGQVLKKYFTERGIAGLQTVDYFVIDELQDKDPKRFKTHGLRNLVRKLGDSVRQYGLETLVIDATGGYKAQIAIAVVFGQALSIPVLYRFERFSEIIDFPPMPIVFDYDLLGQNADLLVRFENGEDLTYTELETLDEKVRVLLNEIDVEGETLFGLGPVGQIFLDAFRLKFPHSRELQPVASADRSHPSFRDDHYPIGFQDFVHKVWEETPWIKSCHSLSYDKQKSIKGIGFYVRNDDKLIGTYKDKDNFGARFEILTDAIGNDQLTWAVDQLNQKYQLKKKQP